MSAPGGGSGARGGPRPAKTRPGKPAAGPAAPAGAAVRAAAARTLDAVLSRGRSLTAALAAELPKLGDARDRALLEAICYETVRRRRRYESLRDALLERPLPEQAQPVPALLLAGLAQLDGLGMAPYAVISATAEAARVLRRPRMVGLVNGVLRRFERERTLRTAAADTAAARHRDHPAWLRRAFERDWAADATLILAANNVPAPLWLRVNRRRVARDDYRQQLAAAGIDAEAPQHPPDALRLDTPVAPTVLPGWNEGALSVQDAAAQFALGVLAPAAGDRVLDACAAPGGKAAHLLEGVEGLVLHAIDRDPERLERVRAGLSRLGLSAPLTVADATEPGAWWDRVPYQRILIDAPCSGTGVIRRHPDIKWHRRDSDIAALVAQQAALLDALWPLLAPGGRLVYATCSVLKDENERQIDAFLARHGDAAACGPALPVGRASGGGWQILPGEGGMDGFFYAALQRAC